jgi:tyrosyl-tRNA synthetase
MSSSALLEELGWRGLVHLRSEGLEQRLAAGPVSAYIGFDASATSLHVGHLLQVFLLTHLQRAGGRPVVLIGGGTGMIGDPSGKSSERQLLDADAIERNSAALKSQLERFLDFSPGPTQPRMLNNLDWLGQMSMIDYLRDIGKYFTVPYMLSKDSVQARLAAGMSFTEFSYQTLQAADFLHLHRHEGVDLQMGGADQWGNITAGLELIRRVESRDGAADDDATEGHEPTAFGLCSPLLLNRAGVKMGKSEKGAVFLDGSLTSPYDFYQYWINDEDEVVVDHLRWLTTMSRQEVEAIAAEHEAAPEKRVAQKAIAHDLTARIHGAEEAARQVVVAEAAFATVVDDPAVLAVLYDAVGGFEFGAEADGWTAVDVAVAASGQSRGEARRLISQGGFRINGQQLTDPAAAPPALIGERYWWVAMGKKRRFVGRRTG